MAWIESHDDVWEHYKTLKLTRLLGIRRAEAVGCLHSLWHFVLRNAWRDANLEAWGDEGIEFAARWEGNAGEMVAALREVGYLDGSVVHGWSERAGRLVEDRKRKESGKNPTAAERTSFQESRGTSGLTVPNRTVPNRTVPNPTVPYQHTQGAEKAKKAVFVVPSLDEVKAYCLERKNTIDPEKFWHHYEARNWMLGEKKMVKWKSAVITWEKSGYNVPATQNKSGGIKPAPGKYDGVGMKEGSYGN